MSVNSCDRKPTPTNYSPGLLVLVLTRHGHYHWKTHRGVPPVPVHWLSPAHAPLLPTTPYSKYVRWTQLVQHYTSTYNDTATAGFNPCTNFTYTANDPLQLQIYRPVLCILPYDEQRSRRQTCCLWVRSRVWEQTCCEPSLSSRAPSLTTYHPPPPSVGKPVGRLERC